MTLGITIVTINTLITTVASNSLSTVDAEDISIQELHTLSVVGTWAWFAVIWCSRKGIAIKSRGTFLTVHSRSVVFTNTLTSVSVTALRMSVAVAWNTTFQGISIWWVSMVTRRAGLAELANVSLWAGTLFHMIDLGIGSTLPGRMEFHLINKADSCWSVSSSDLDSSDVRQQLVEFQSSKSRIPLVIRVFIEPELVFLLNSPWHRVRLRVNWGVNLVTISLNDNIKKRRLGTILSCAQFEFQKLIVAVLLVSEVTLWCNKVCCLLRR